MDNKYTTDVNHIEMPLIIQYLQYFLSAFVVLTATFQLAVFLWLLN